MRRAYLSTLAISNTALVWGWVIVGGVIVVSSNRTGYGSLIELSIQPLWLLSLLFLWSRQVITLAMMLLSSLPWLGLFIKVTVQSGQEKSSFVLLAFLLAHFLVWTGFALLALVCGLGWYFLFQVCFGIESPWLTVFILMVAGWFQFNYLKQRIGKDCEYFLEV